jgi:hypothetical protein
MSASTCSSCPPKPLCCVSANQVLGILVVDFKFVLPLIKQMPKGKSKRAVEARTRLAASPSKTYVKLLESCQIRAVFSAA